jgi:hypothetical protein
VLKSIRPHEKIIHRINVCNSCNAQGYICRRFFLRQVSIKPSSCLYLLLVWESIQNIPDWVYKNHKTLHKACRSPSPSK